MERGIVARESDLPFHAIPAAGVRGRSPLNMVRSLATLARGTRAAQQVIARTRPAAVLGTGGYVCVPLFLAARTAGVPTMVYLPDVVPGLAVRLLSRLATLTACHVDDSLPYLRSGFFALGSGLAGPRQIEVVGYPVRPELFSLDRAACRALFGFTDALPVVLVYGGSRGARSINRAIAALLPALLELAQVVHVCGREGDEGPLRDAASRLPEQLRHRYRLYPYLPGQLVAAAGQAAAEPTMLAAFGAADLVVARSGASTMAELPAAALPAVLVPYPYVHQEQNADYLVQRGAAIKVRDHDMLGTGRPEDGPLFRSIRCLLEDDAERTHMAERSRALARPGAASQLAELLLDLAARRSPV